MYSLSDSDDSDVVVLKDKKDSPSQDNLYSLSSDKFNYKTLLNPHTDPELESILRKYGNFSAIKQNTEPIQSKPCIEEPFQNKLTTLECIELSSDEETNTTVGPVTPPFVHIRDTEIHLDSNYLHLNNHLSDDLSQSSNSPRKKKSKLSPEVKERRKAERAAERAKKKEEILTNKALKQVVAAANRNEKPKECIKFITVIIDPEISNSYYGSEVEIFLKSESIECSLQSQLVHSTITWNRIVNSHTVNNGTLKQTSEVVETDQVIKFMDWKEAVDLIHSKQLTQHIKSLQTILSNKKLFLGIHGLQNYFKFRKSQRQKDLRNEITQSTNTTNNVSKYKDAPKISRNDAEFALTELQILCGCSHQLVETKRDVAYLVKNFTKAVAEIPFKLERNLKEQEASHYIWEDNKNTVAVNNSGIGLQRLWQQQLISFPKARIEHAQAIITKYPTLASLLEEYTRCSEQEGEKLLQDILIRRGAGQLNGTRKLGPEMSKKIYVVLTSLDKERLCKFEQA